MIPACRLSSLYFEQKHSSSPIMPRASHEAAASPSAVAHSPFAAAEVQQTPMVGPLDMHLHPLCTSSIMLQC